MDRKEMQNARLYLLALFLILVLLCYLGILYDTQVVHHEDYIARSVRSIVREEKVEASRGIITDRNGQVLVSNRATYDLTFDSALLTPKDDINTAVLRLVELCRSQGVGWTDNLPVSQQAPFVYTLDTTDNIQKGRFLTYLKSLKPIREALGAYLLRHPELIQAQEEPAAVNASPDGEEAEAAPSLSEQTDALLNALTSDQLTTELLTGAGITPAQLLAAMRTDFDIPAGYSQSDARLTLGVRYELNLRKLGNYDAYILAQDIDTVFISILSDGNYAGARVSNAFVREYQTDCAAHILGYVGKIDKYTDELKEQGYRRDDWIGREGTELAFEQYLKGTDGYRMVSSNTEGKITGEYYSKEPEPGDIVELTIDLNFQRQVESILAETVEKMNAKDHDEKRGAGAAVIKVGTGEVLALASYPTYDLATFRQSNEAYSQLLNDPATPMFNRATQGTYAPGSTLKPFTAIAALEGGYVTLKEKIRDDGHWEYPNDRTGFGFWCWKHSGHGLLNVSQAVTHSCNFFFGEMGYRMGMTAFREWLQKFGLGVKTGIEIEERAGLLPENPQGQDQAPWAGFGQATQVYSPLQLANYIATLVSGGKHCQAHLLKAAKAYDNSSVTALGNTEPVNTIPISDANLQAVKEGMHGLVHGTLWPYFSSCVVDAGAKTGTAQVYSNQKNNGVFVCFAPYDDPEIAVAIAIERGDAGANLASTAVGILNAYFAVDEAAAGITGEYELLP